YVAITRARDELHVTVPLRYHKADNGLSDQHGLAQLSRFLQPVRHLFIEESPPTASLELSPVTYGAVTAVHDRLASLWAG
ncbi:MAG: ATP-dependent exoDNAse (exonuclease V) beta subunit, partial [Glaciecola sp.]